MKKITSLTLGFSFIIMSITGVVLYIVPKGKVAYWSEWSLWGLDKHQYGELHTTSMVVFLVFGVLHIFYNFKPILSYLRDSSRKISFTKREFLVALFINVAFVAGTLADVPPFSSFLTMQEKIKSNWEDKLGSPPYGHAEDSPLSEFCQRMGLDLEEAQEKLERAGVEVRSENQPLKGIARKNSISVQEVYEIIK
jgi:hypothetical protein